MPRITRDTLKHLALALMLVGVAVFYVMRGTNQSYFLPTEVHGQLVIKENGETISSAPITSCLGTVFGPQFYTKDNEGVGFARDIEKRNLVSIALRPMVEYYQPPTGGRFYGRPCTFPVSNIENGYPLGAYLSINLFSGRRVSRDRGQEYWSGSLRAECQLENAQSAPSGKSFEVTVDFKNCKPSE
ncbi:MAG: hypothetical protein AAB554_00535 [Patescibacteria group bacterium]